ncbi:MAG TPA: 3-isopropylmalate dehydratase small subunit [Desulfosporosinus sp.]|nr:3-isopropylmalate dehydratase small subunit [Desulfosporosinus sp.]
MIKGRVWKYEKNVDTDVIYPGRYLVHFDPVEVAKHAMEGIDSEFASKVKLGDIIVAGENFGTGSAREQAAMTLKFAGLGAIIADSFSRTFYRNAINNGLPVISLKGVSLEIKEGDVVEIDLEKGEIKNLSSGKELFTSPVPKFIREILAVGGAIPYYQAKLKEQDIHGHK